MIPGRIIANISCICFLLAGSAFAQNAQKTNLRLKAKTRQWIMNMKIQNCFL